MLTLGQIMQRDVVSVDPQLTLRELLEVFAETEVSGAPVVTGGKVVGVISTTDILDFRGEAPEVHIRPGAAPDESTPARRGGFLDRPGTGEIDALEWIRAARRDDWSLLDEYTVSDVMTPQVMSQPSHTTVKDAASYMLEAGIRRVLVIDDGELRGIVTTTDIVRAVAEGALTG
jgi:CBS domain-containing protein